MNMFIKSIAASGMALAFVAPAFAETAMMDPMKMTCAEYGKMDSAGRMSATQQMEMMMVMTDEERTAAMAMTAEETAAKKAERDATMMSMTPEQKTAAETTTKTSMEKMMAACAAMPDGTVIDAAKAPM